MHHAASRHVTEKKSLSEIDSTGEKLYRSDGEQTIRDRVENPLYRSAQILFSGEITLYVFP
jgi:hypothetical protein